MFAKVFSQIFDSSIAENYTTRHLFMDLLVLADRDGVVDITFEGIARRTNIPIQLVREGIAELTLPDPSSRSPEENGQRIVLIDSHRDWGWQIVNYQHYRELRDEEARKGYFRDYKREYRAAKKLSKTSVGHNGTPVDSPHLSTPVLDSPTLSTQADAEAEAEALKEKEQREKPAFALNGDDPPLLKKGRRSGSAEAEALLMKEFEEFWAEYPNGRAAKEAWIVWKKLKPPLDRVLETLGKYKKTDWRNTDKQFIPKAVNWLKGERWDDEL